MFEGREAPLPPAGLQPEDSGRQLILPTAYGEAGERDNAPGDRAAGGRRVEGEHPRAARWSAGLRVDRAGHRQALRELARRLTSGCRQKTLGATGCPEKAQGASVTAVDRGADPEWIEQCTRLLAGVATEV